MQACIAGQRVLDFFRDGDSRVRKNQAPNDFVVIMHMAMNLLNKAKDKNPCASYVKRQAGTIATFFRYSVCDVHAIPLVTPYPSALPRAPFTAKTFAN